MKVTVKLFATLRNFGPEEQQQELPENSTIEDVMRTLKLPQHLPILKVVNGEHRDLKHRLKDGDDIAFFPPIAGGQRELIERFIRSY
ncbi:MAG TPA: molybdopterin synthase sulfur carrier subunit [Nitrospiraceae bacterium]|jgi:molybdopterin synthase sulfur carrier subunit|nr:molybdopterin synthase sulfur carrier subunit [Nitrospiraceae bacterium]